MKTKMLYKTKKRIRIFYIFGILSIAGILYLISAKCMLTPRNDSESIHPVIAKMLETLNIHGCTLTSLPDYNDICVPVKTPAITEDEYSEYVQTQREEDSETTENELRSQFLEEKKVQNLMQARKKVMDMLLSGGRFSLQEEYVAAYAKTIVQNYETEAELYDMDIAQYHQEILGYTKEKFYQHCYEEGAETIKTYLIIGAIAKREFPDLEQIPDGKILPCCCASLYFGDYSVFPHYLSPMPKNPPNVVWRC